jgi:DNA relaxase NicK
MDIEVGIDWIEVTAFSIKTAIDERIYGRAHKIKHSRGMNGYSDCTTTEHMVKILTSSNRADMGQHIIYSGKSLADIERKGIMTKLQILQQHIDAGHKLTRLDVYVDAINSGLDIDNLFQQARNKLVDTRARKILYMTDGATGQTLYVGSKSKRKKLLRIYDKAAEQGVDGDWKRIELQVMRDSAYSLASSLSNGQSMTDLIIGSIRGFADFKTDSVWSAIMDYDKVQIASQRHQGKQTQEWIIKQVIPALARECVADFQFWTQFSLLLNEHMESEKQNDKADS